VFSDWEPKFRNLLRGIPGASEVPLIYVLRDENWTYNAADYMQSIVALAPLSGTAFIADSDMVFNYLRSFITDDPEEHWFDDNTWGGDGRILMIKLRERYGTVAPMVPEVVAAVADVVQVVILRSDQETLPQAHKCKPMQFMEDPFDMLIVMIIMFVHEYNNKNGCSLLWTVCNAYINPKLTSSS
jgi:hypothetical protein